MIKGNSNKSWTDFLEELLANERSQKHQEARVKRRKDSRGPDGLVEETIEFPDDFAPGRATFGISGGLMLSPDQKGQFYGDDWSFIGQAALDWSAAQGLPPLAWPLPFGWFEVDEPTWSAVHQQWRHHIEAADESSEEWLCFLIYFHALELSRLLTVQPSVGLLLETTFVLGGVVRELDLARRNKKDALKAKKQNRALADASWGRGSYAARRKAAAKEWQSHAENIFGRLRSQMSQSATAKYILANWDEAGGGEPTPPKPAKKTIQHWLGKNHPTSVRGGTKG